MDSFISACEADAGFVVLYMCTGGGYREHFKLSPSSSIWLVPGTLNMED